MPGQAKGRKRTHECARTYRLFNSCAFDIRYMSRSRLESARSSRREGYEAWREKGESSGGLPDRAGYWVSDESSARSHPGHKARYEAVFLARKVADSGSRLARGDEAPLYWYNDSSTFQRALSAGNV